METKNQNVSFLKDVKWLNDLAFLSDVTQHLAQLNGQLQEGINWQIKCLSTLHHSRGSWFFLKVKLATLCLHTFHV